MVKKQLKLQIFKIWRRLKNTPEPKVILILSHMRAGSSLIEHILSSNSEILGMGERGRIYRDKDDFEKLELVLRWSSKQLITKYNFIVDQILHEDLIPNLSILNSKKIKIIFLIRKPLEAISSLENLGGPEGLKNQYSLSSSINYYQNRLSTLIQISNIIDANSQYIITYEDLISNPDKTLVGLSNFLKLKNHLNQYYNIKKTTGLLGDRSPNIKQGTIINTTKKLKNLKNKQLEELSNLYSSALKIISSNSKK